jgi:rRNA-processing protein FCF1
MTYLFVDTNIFLHYKFFIEIPWQTIFRNEFEIVLAPVVMDELDKHKRHPNPKTASRAKKVLTKIEEINDQPGSYPFRYIYKRPSQDTFDQYQLDRKEQDDCILAVMLEFKSQHPNDQILLISNDTGPRFRAASLGIEAAKLVEDYLNPTEKTEEQKQIQKLTQEIFVYKNKIPKVSLCFKDDAIHYQYKLKPILDTTEAFISLRMASIKEKYPPLVWEDPELAQAKLAEELKSQPKGTPLEEAFKSNRLLSGLQMNNSVSKEQVENFNKDNNDFVEKYRQYLGKQFTLSVIKSLSLPIAIQMKNEGNVPALDIDIWLHFPDGFELYSVGDYPKKTKEPKPPYRPKHRYDTGLMIVPSISSVYSSGTGSIPNINFNQPTIRKTNSYEVDFHINSLKHFQSHDLERLIVVFPSYEKIKNFTIDYEIVIGNVPEPVVGKLSVKAELDGGDNVAAPSNLKQ